MPESGERNVLLQESRGLHTGRAGQVSGGQGPNRSAGRSYAADTVRFDLFGMGFIRKILPGRAKLQLYGGHFFQFFGLKFGIRAIYKKAKAV